MAAYEFEHDLPELNLDSWLSDDDATATDATAVATVTPVMDATEPSSILDEQLTPTQLAKAEVAARRVEMPTKTNAEIKAKIKALKTDDYLLVNTMTIPLGSRQKDKVRALIKTGNYREKIDESPDSDVKVLEVPSHMWSYGINVQKLQKQKKQCLFHIMGVAHTSGLLPKTLDGGCKNASCKRAHSERMVFLV